MAPSPQETIFQQGGEASANTSEPVSKPLNGDEVVISGLSGIFPKSDSVKEFMQNLYNKVDMVSCDDPRWIFNHPEVPKHLGKVNGMGKFDSQFFRVHYKQACTMEPMSRKLLEHAYSAIYDSGINPLQLRGKKVGVFIGSTFSESEKIVIYENIQRNGFGITGCNKSMYANRISYWIDGKGPSYALDLACASSLACLEHAYRSISTGQCEAAIVGGCNLCMHPNVSLNCKRAGLVCMDGKTKCFDKNGDGYVRSDAIGVIFVQKAKDAKRIYSEVYYAKSNYSAMPSDQLLPIRESKEIQQFFKAFYSEIDVSPNDVEYVEACGAAIAKADGAEMEAIGNIFAKEKNIKIGCVKSNMGSGEPASGICSLTKICLAYHQGKIPGNLHYYEPQEHISAVKDGRVQVLTDTTPFNRGYVALNSFSYSGADIHVLLKGHYKPKDPERYKCSIPYLVLASGRQENCVENILVALKNNPLDPEQIGMLHNIHERDIPGHMCRGYSLLEKNEKNQTSCLAQSIEYYPGSSRPLWFVYSGMGSQWAGMGAELMRIPIFAAAIQKCHRVLEPRGIDIVKILTDPDKTIYDNILNSFVGIAAVQIGLTDILTEMGIVPDNIIGHSVGELGCAYADGCFTAEEMILAAYSRGLVSIQTPFIRGSMAAVGLGHKNILALCPPEIEVACHNSADSSTISGPADVMKKFVSELTSSGIFAKEVPCSNIAYHSRYIADAGPGLLKYLSEVIKDPKVRSEKWVSTSVPQDKWGDEAAKYSSAEYHTNNLLNSVLFEETSKLIPANAMVIEIAPHGLLQAILKRSLSECLHIPPTRRGHADPVKYLLESIGKMYQAGLQPKVKVLYPTIEYPVATETPLLSHLVKWEHSEDWPQAKYNNKIRVTATSRDFVMSIHDDDYKYFSGHIREGSYVFPEAAFLVLVWETLAMYKGVEYKDLSVTFSDVHFHGEAIISVEVPLRLTIMKYKGNNKFEITYEDSEIVSGYITGAVPADFTERQVVHTEVNNDMTLTANEIYTIMKLRDYSYEDKFQSIYSSNGRRTKANIKWNDNWILFLDGLLQFNAFAREHDGVSIPSRIKKLSINVKEHRDTKVVDFDGITCMDANLYSIYKYTKCGGVQLDNVTFIDKPVMMKEPDVLQTRVFVPYFVTGSIELKTALEVNFQIVTDNTSNTEINVIKLLEHEDSDISSAIKDVSAKFTSAEFIVNSISFDNIHMLNQEIGETNLIIVDNLLGNIQKMQILCNVLSRNSFIIALEDDTTKINPQYKLFNIISAMTVQKKVFVLLNKADYKDDITYLPVNRGNKFSWVPTLQAELEKSKKVVLISEREPYCGLFGLVKQLKQEYGNKISLVLVDDFYHVPSFNPEKDIFKEQLKKNLTFNVLRKGQWGSYYYLSHATSTTLQDVFLTSVVPGNLDSLTWSEKPSTTESKNLIQVSYAGVSLRDAQYAAGRSTGNRQYPFGMDFSGIDSNGQRVMGVIQGGALSSTVVPDSDLIWPVPDHWSLEEAASVPLSYLQAYYCLTIKCEVQKGWTVLVHNGTDAFSQAIISICLDLDCKVFTTVSNVDKKEFLLKLFPKLKENHIINSQLNNFHDIVLENTGKQRCEIVINRLSGNLRKAAMNCVGFCGLFLDLSDHDMISNNDFGMFFLFEAKEYVSVQLSVLFKPEFSAEKKKLHGFISAGIANGIVKPISRVVYNPVDVSKAFRLLSTNKHRGNILIRMRDEEKTAGGLKAIARMTFSSKGSYIVICDESLLSVELVDRLVKRGAENIVVHMNAAYAYTKIVAWKKWNVTLKVTSENLKTEQGCTNLFSEAKKLGPILGIFIVQNFSSEGAGEHFSQPGLDAKFNDVIRLIVNLDLNSRNICNELKHFVIFKYGSKTAANAYVSSVIDKICQYRNEITLPALVLRVDSISELDRNTEIIQSKVPPLSISSVLNAFESSLKLKHNNVLTFNAAKRIGNNFLANISKILGVKDIAEISENHTLKDLSINEINIQEIIEAIKDEYGISYTKEKVKEMTIESIINMERCVLKSNLKFDSGLGAFFTFIDQDECLATEPMIAMTTKFSNVKEEDELDPKATYLMLIPGFEGHHKIFVPVCERLKVQALTFQLGPDMMDDTIQQMALNIMKFMKNRFELKSKFYLLGYSFGVNVALELAALFEKEGHVGIVYCLDSSPDALRIQLDAYVGNLSDTQMQNSLVQYMYRLMCGHDSAELKADLEKNESWPQKIEACVNRLRGLVKYSHQYKRSILHGAYKKILLAREYEPNFQLESRLILIKGIAHPKAVGLADDYNLHKYTKQPVEVFNLESDHALAPQDCRVSNIINRQLDSNLLEEFNKKNLCETYLAEFFKIF